MAKEFKQYDKVFRKYMFSFLDYENEEEIDRLSVNYNSWALTDSDSFSNKEVREAVYESATAEEWQKFRVSLKGFNTQYKLAKLEYRYDYMQRQFAEGEINEDELHREEIRIDNYIGALRRGGQLDANYNVVK